MNRHLSILATAGALLLCVSAPAISGPAKDFDAAESQIEHIYRDYPVTFDCGCVYKAGSGSIEPHSCGLDLPQHRSKAQQMTWSHVMPVSYYGKMMTCWHDAPPGMSGLDHCKKTSALFNRISADLVNIEPADAALEVIRGDHLFGQVKGQSRSFGRCEFKDDGQFSQPPPWARGSIARIFLYMHRVYQIPIGKESMAIFKRWSDSHPPDGWDKTRAERIGDIQGAEYTIQFAH